MLTCELREQTDLFLPWTHLLLCNMSMLTTSKLLHVFIGEEKKPLKVSWKLVDFCPCK